MLRLNSEIASKSELILLSQSDLIGPAVSEFNYDWSNNRYARETTLASIFTKYGWTTPNFGLTRIGRLVYSRLSLHFENIDKNKLTQIGNYKIDTLIRNGKNSAVFSGRHILLGTAVVLKFVRPGASDDIISSVKRLGSATLPRNIVMPIDAQVATIFDSNGKPVEVTCLVFPALIGSSFSDFLSDGSYHLNSHVVVSFIRQIGFALASLERANAYHGDLHDHNIIVTKAPNGSVEFNLIDISFDAVGSLSLKDAQNDDLENFSTLVWRLLSNQKKQNPRLSLRKFIGSDYYFRIEKLLSGKMDSFAELEHTFKDKDYNRDYLTEKDQFLRDRFQTPASFRLQRYEEFTDPAIAAKLFVPLPELREKILQFSNVYVSGNRGSGKSTYLASLAFFPSVSAPLVDFTDIFGIYFPCRQGEFRTLSHIAGDKSPADPRVLQHILILKVVRRAIEAVAKGIQTGKIRAPGHYEALLACLNRFLPAPGILILEGDVVSEIENFLSTVIRAELWASSAENYRALFKLQLCTSDDLIAFLHCLRNCFGELASTRFHLLFDDAGEPFVPSTVQKAINDLMISSNSTYCVKISAEKHTYEFITSENKVLEVGHDYFEHDITFNLYFGVKETGLLREHLEDYFRKIVEGRLRHFNYKSDNIISYLGNDAGQHDELMRRLMAGSKNAYYCGWSDVWHIADRTPRTLLEIVSEIFAVASIEPSTPPLTIPRRDQDRAIRTISEKRLQSLSQISGAFYYKGSKTSLGRHLYDVTVTLGSAFKVYLTAQRDAPRASIQPRQHLAIERNDITPLTSEAEFILKKLVSFGVLDSSKAFVARDDKRKKPIYVLNRVYCPAFSIGYRRDDHIPLSRGKLEQLLLVPHSFRKGGTAILQSSMTTSIEQGDFFDSDEE